MKNLLFIAVAVMFTSLSAFALSDGYQLVSDQTIHKIDKQHFDHMTLAPVDQSLFAEVSGVLAIQSESSTSETFPNFVTSATLIDLNLFYWPIVYEQTVPAESITFYNPNGKFKKEKPIDKKFRKRQLVVV